MTFSHFLGKFKNGPFWPKLTQIWPKFGHFGQKLSKIGVFGPKCRKNGGFSHFSRNPFISISYFFVFLKKKNKKKIKKFFQNFFRKFFLNTCAINPNFEPFEAQNDLFLTISGQNQANLRMTRNQQFQLQLY